MFNSIPKLLICIAWSVVLCAHAEADHVRQVQCTATRSPEALIGEDECRWLWHRSEYLQVSQEYSKNWDAWLDNKVRGQELVNQIADSIANALDFAENVLGEATFSTALADTAVDLGALWVTSLPVDEDTTLAISRDWSVRVTETFWATSKMMAIGTEATFPYDDFLRLANDFGFLVNEMRITRWRYTEIVINEYLFHYFVDGRGAAETAESFGMKSNASRKKVFDAIYDQNKSSTKILGVYDQGYNQGTVEKAVSSMIEVVTRFGNERVSIDAGNVPAQFPQTREGTLSVTDALRVLDEKSEFERHSALKKLEPKLDAPLKVKDIVNLAGLSSGQFYDNNIRLLEPTWPPLMSVQDALDIIGSLEKQHRASLLRSLYPYLQSNISPRDIGRLAGGSESDNYRRIVLQAFPLGSSSIAPQEGIQLLAGTSDLDRLEIIRAVERRLPYLVQPNDIVALASNADESFYAKIISLLAMHLPTRISVADYENLLGTTEGVKRKILEKRIMERVETIAP